MSEPVVREPRPADARALSELHVGGWQWAYTGIIPAAHLDNLDLEPRVHLWAERLATAEGRSRVAVADAGNELAGFVSWARYRYPDLGTEVGEVQAIYLAQSWQGRGVGHALMARAVQGLAALGYREAKLWVLEANTLARRFYERQGWRADGATQVEEFAGEPLTELRYGRALS